MLKLHYHPFSTFARRVRIALIEKNIPAELVEVDMVARAHRGPAYLALNPYGRVPTLEEDGFVLYESTAILDYLEATHPTPPLVPADARGRALVAMHMKLCDIQMARQTGHHHFPQALPAQGPLGRGGNGAGQEGDREAPGDRRDAARRASSTWWAISTPSSRCATRRSSSSCR